MLPKGTTSSHICCEKVVPFLYFKLEEELFMLLEAIYHRPKQNWSYAYDIKTIHLRLRTKRDDVDKVKALICDKYAFKETKKILPMKKFASDDLFDYWQIAAQPEFNRLQYGFKLQSGDQTLWFTESGFSKKSPKQAPGLYEYPYLNAVDVFQPPTWVKDAIFYQIFPERFANGDPTINPEKIEEWGATPTPKNFFGGDLQGVIDHLDYLKHLGINAIYFNPLFEATTNHKYDTQDYMKIDSQFGTNEKLKQLVEACHERGIRVMLDAVFNHCGGTFPPFLDVKEKGADSPYYDWFHIREFPLKVKKNIPTYETFAFEPIMPKLNTENAEVKKYFLEVAKYWIEDIGIDGWRLDVANEVDHQFWREFRDVVKDANPDVYILGEIWHDSMMWLQGDQFDAVMNYPFTNAVLDFFTKNLLDGYQFANKIGSLLANYPQQVNEVAFNLLDSHDTPRLLTICKEDKRRMKLASLFQFTFTGAPCIYYGNEVGLTGDHDPDCRKCMEWDEAKQDRELLEFFQELITLRRLYPALRGGDFQFLHAQPGDPCIAYERKDNKNHFVMIMNSSKKKQSVSIELPPGKWTEVWTRDITEVTNAKTKIVLPAYSATILKLNK
jgi:cyclomaltodextrinase